MSPIVPYTYFMGPEVPETYCLSPILYHRHIFMGPTYSTIHIIFMSPIAPYTYFHES